jgi:hypothetical protein
MLKRLSVACVLAAFVLFCILCIWIVQRTSQQAPNNQHTERSAESQYLAPDQKAAPNLSSPESHVIVPGDVDVKRTSKSGESGHDHTERFQGPVEWFIKFLIDIKITDVLLAFFTFLLAIYTGRLWVATRALADSDRPHMLVDTFKLSGIQMPPVDDGRVQTRFEYKFINYGRSPAFMQRYIFAFTIIPEQDLPSSPEYGTMEPTNFIIGVNGWYGSVEPSMLLITQEDVAAVLNGTKSFIIYGAIEYSDVAGILHKHRFSYKFEWDGENVSKRFRPVGPDSYREYT